MDDLVMEPPPRMDLLAASVAVSSIKVTSAPSADDDELGRSAMVLLD